MQVVGCPVAQADLPGAGEATQGQRACCAAGHSSGGGTDCKCRCRCPSEQMCPGEVSVMLDRKEANWGLLTGGTGADALAARLATLELENQRKDAEIAALRGQSGGPGSSRPADRPETPASTATGADDIAPGVSLNVNP